MREIFLVLLVILIAIGGLGYLINEVGDLNEKLQDKEKQNQELISLLAQKNTTMDDLQRRITECQTAKADMQKQDTELQKSYTQIMNDLTSCELQLKAIQDAYTQAKTTLDITSQDLNQTQIDLKTCQTYHEERKSSETQSINLLQKPTKTAEPFESISQEMPEDIREEIPPSKLKSSVPKEMVATIMISFPVAVMLLYAVRVKSLMPKELPHSAKQTIRQQRNNGQVTVKMDHQAYQSYLEYLTNSNK